MTRSGTGRSRWRFGVGASLAAVLAVLALGAGAATAATPIDLGTAEATGPGLALLPSGGAALTTVTESGTGEDLLHYCRIEPGAGGCSATTNFVNPLATFTADHGNMPLVEGSQVFVTEARAIPGSTEDKLLWTGEPFGSSTNLGTTASTPGSSLAFGDAVLAAKGTVNATNPVIATIETGPNSSEGPIVTASNLTAGSGKPLKFHITSDSVSDSAISLQGSMLSAAWISQTQPGAVVWRRYLTGGGTPEAIQNGANWSAPVMIGSSTGAGQVRMASGPKGLYVAYLRPGDQAVEIQRFNGLGFDPPVAISEGGVFEFAFTEDSSGLLHLAYRGDGGPHYRYAKDASNAVFSSPQTLPESDYRNMRIVTTAAGTGWLSWWDDNTKHVFALPLAPGEPTPPAPAPVPGGGGAPTPPKKTGKEPKHVIFGAIGHGLVGELSVPKECVPGGQVFKAKVAVKRKGSKAHKLSYTVKQVGFFLGKKKISTDKKKPFEVGFATKGVGAGKSLAVSAKISVTIHAGHRHSVVSKTLKTSVRTCG